MKKTIVLAASVAVAAQWMGEGWAQDANAPIIARGVIIGQADTKPGKTSVMRIDRVADQAAGSAVGLYLFGTGALSKSGGETVGVFSWQAVSPSPSLQDAETVEPLAPALTTMSRLDGKTVVPANTELSISGDSSGLIRAIKKLSTERESAEEAAGGETATTSSRDSEGQSAGTIPGGSEGEANNLATPPPLNVQPGTPDPVVPVVLDKFGVSSLGCDPEISQDPVTGLGTVTVTEKITRNGVPEGECKPTGITTEIKATSLGCGYDVRKEDRVAVDMNRKFYVLGGTSTPLDEVCVVNETVTYKIDEVSTGCPVTIKPGGLMMAQHTKLEFRGRDNGVQPVEGCKDRGVIEFPITYTTNDCELRHDFPGQKSFERHRATYFDEKGALQSHGQCFENGTNYVHFKDTAVCPDLPDFDQNKYFKQFRIRIDLPNGPDHITEICEPFATELTQLQLTPVGCESLHTDLPEQGISRGFKQVVRLDNNESVRGCQEVSDIEYPHVYEIQSYRHDDVAKLSYKIELTVINLPAPFGRTPIIPAQERPGVAPVAYIPQGVARTVAGPPRYADGTCDRYETQFEEQTFIQGGGTTVNLKVRDLPETGPVHDCTQQVRNSWPVIVDEYVGSNNCGPNLFVPVTQCTFAGERRFLRGDGALVGGVEEQTRVQRFNGLCGHGAGQRPACPSGYDYFNDRATIDAWMLELGWDRGAGY